MTIFIFVRSVLSCGVNDQIFLVCPVGLMTRFLFRLYCAAVDQIFVRSILSCVADDEILVWSDLWAMMTRFLFGTRMSCTAADHIFVRSILSCGADDQTLVWSNLWAMMPRFLFGTRMSCTAVDQIFVRSSCFVGLMIRFWFGLSCGDDAQIFVWYVLWGWRPDFCPVSLVLWEWWSDFCLVCLVGLMPIFLSGQSCPVALITRLLSGVSCGADDQISANILNTGVILPWGVLSGERRGSVRCRKSLPLSQALIYIFPDSALFRPYLSALKIMNNIHTASRSMNYLT